MKLTKDIKGCADGDVYPRIFAAGDECPPELEAAAHELGALGKGDKGKAAPAPVVEPAPAAATADEPDADPAPEAAAG